MATFQEDIDRLTKDVADQGALIQQVATKEAADATTIADLKTQLAALQGQQNPDLSGLEAGLNTLEKNNQALGGLLPQPAPPDNPPAETPATPAP